MPEKEVRKRGSTGKVRTVSVGKGKYMHCEVVKKAGPRGGKTVCGPVRKKK